MKQVDVAQRAELLKRRQFFTKAGSAGLAAAAAMVLPGVAKATTPATPDNVSGDTAAQIFTAALIAEDLATCFYYFGLTGPVMQDPALAGPGGSFRDVTANGNLGNVQYLQAALAEEVEHANLLRSLLNIPQAAGDPVLTFYFPTGSFNTLSAFTSLLNALESAFIGAYLEATIEFSQMASDARAGIAQQKNPLGGANYTVHQLEYYAQVAASIMGIECEHRVLGRVISNTNPANQLNYEQTDGLTSVYNGSHSAVVALTPFLSPGPNMTAYSFRQALDNWKGASVPTTGNPPAPPTY